MANGGDRGSIGSRNRSGSTGPLTRSGLHRTEVDDPDLEAALALAKEYTKANKSSSLPRGQVLRTLGTDRVSLFAPPVSSRTASAAPVSLSGLEGRRRIRFPEHEQLAQVRPFSSGSPPADVGTPPADVGVPPQVISLRGFFDDDDVDVVVPKSIVHSGRSALVVAEEERATIETSIERLKDVIANSNLTEKQLAEHKGALSQLLARRADILAKIASAVGAKAGDLTAAILLKAREVATSSTATAAERYYPHVLIEAQKYIDSMVAVTQAAFEKRKEAQEALVQARSARAAALASAGPVVVQSISGFETAYNAANDEAKALLEATRATVGAELRLLEAFIALAEAGEASIHIKARVALQAYEKAKKLPITEATRTAQMQESVAVIKKCNEEAAMLDRKKAYYGEMLRSVQRTEAALPKAVDPDASAEEIEKALRLAKKNADASKPILAKTFEEKEIDDQMSALSKLITSNKLMPKPIDLRENLRDRLARLIENCKSRREVMYLLEQYSKLKADNADFKNIMCTLRSASVTRYNDEHGVATTFTDARIIERMQQKLLSLPKQEGVDDSRLAQYTRQPWYTRDLFIASMALLPVSLGIDAVGGFGVATGATLAVGLGTLSVTIPALTLTIAGAAATGASMAGFVLNAMYRMWSSGFRASAASPNAPVATAVTPMMSAMAASASRPAAAAVPVTAH